MTAFDPSLNNELIEFSKLLNKYSGSERKRIMDAAYWGSKLHIHQKRASGEPYFIHPLSVAKTLINMKMDASTIMAALLHDTEEDTEITPADLEDRYGSEVEMLVNGVTKISMSKVSNKTEQSNETIRKMFLAMAQDIRVILIKLADKLHNMDTLQYKKPEKQIKTAQECLDIYAPLAAKLGIYWMKMQLEDRAFQYLNPIMYRDIAAFYKAKQNEQNILMAKVSQQIKQKTFGLLTTEVQTVPHNYYAIYRRLEMQNTTLDNFSYNFGIRFICKKEEDCYRMIGLVHDLYKPLDGHFKDFIAMPKDNQYQGLHTTVMSQDGRPFEVQIRTAEMDHTAEYGITAFWIFNHKSNFNPQDITLVKRIKAWDGLQIEGENFIHGLKNEMRYDVITVFDSEGHAQIIASNYTALDYAFKLGSSTGLGCTSIKIDGNPARLDYKLANNQVIEVTSDPLTHPKLDWLFYVNSPRAKAALTKWYRKRMLHLVKLQGVLLALPKPLNEERILTLATCCHPNHSNHIVALSTEDGLQIHRYDCMVLNESDPDKRYEAAWLESGHFVYRYKVKFHYIPRMFATIEKLAYTVGAELISGSIRDNENDSDELINAQFSIRVEKEQDYLLILERLKQIRAVVSAEGI